MFSSRRIHCGTNLSRNIWFITRLCCIQCINLFIRYWFPFLSCFNRIWFYLLYIFYISRLFEAIIAWWKIVHFQKVMSFISSFIKYNYILYLKIKKFVQNILLLLQKQSLNGDRIYRAFVRTLIWHYHEGDKTVY